MGTLGGAIIFGSHFSLFAEVGYQRMLQGTLKDSNGLPLISGGNTNVGLDLSGGRFLAGAAILF